MIIMEEKYYTPSIEEFYEGFEYERYNPGANEEYLKQTFSLCDVNFVVNCFSKNFQDAWIRVKCLDKEDIKSLVGAVKISEDTFEIPYNDPRMVDDKLHIIFRGTWILICQGNNEKAFGDWTTRFSGIIKNKSELKKILKMIGV